MDSDYVDIRIKEVVEEQEKLGGINILRLVPNTKLTVKTAHSVYEIVVLGKKEITIFGGSLPGGGIRFPVPKVATFIGSTWGSALLKFNWIGYKMRMEIVVDEVSVLTSPVQNVEIQSSDGEWSYSMDWLTS